MINYSLIDMRADIEKIATLVRDKYVYVYGVPKGGIPFAFELANQLDIDVLDEIEGQEENKNVLVVDDIIDSGRTRQRFKDFDFACLHIKDKSVLDTTKNVYFANEVKTREWIHYWWEGEEKPAEDAIIRIIEAIGDDPNREGLLETPKRVINSWKQLFCGYEGDSSERISKMFTQFSSDGYDEMVLLKDIEFFSFCEHHLLPFFGKAHIAYIPKDKVVGISKLARLMDIHSRKFQIQERIGELITKDIMTHLNARGAACIIEAQHLCMKMRGVNKQHSVMTTSSMKGVFLDKPEVRNEFLQLVNR